MKSTAIVRRDGSRIPAYLLERDLARLREIHAQLAASGLTRGELDRSHTTHETVETFEAIFGDLERDETWLTDIDFARWYELGRRERTDGLTRAEGAEMLEFRRRYEEALASGREPGGECYVLEYKPIRYADGEDG